MSKTLCVCHFVTKNITGDVADSGSWYGRESESRGDECCNGEQSELKVDHRVEI